MAKGQIVNMKKTIAQQIVDKQKYYETMERKMMREYIKDTKKSSRDAAIRCGERVVAYAECIELIKGLEK